MGMKGSSEGSPTNDVPLVSKTSARHLRRPSPRHFPHPPNLVWLERNTSHVAVCSSLPPLFPVPSPISVPLRFSERNRGSTPPTFDWRTTEKRSRGLYESEGNSRKRFKTGGDAPPEPVSETPSRRVKQAPNVQSAIYAAHIISSSFNVTHTINILLVGASIRFEANFHALELPDRHFRPRHLDRSTKRHRISSHRHR